MLSTLSISVVVTFCSSFQAFLSILQVCADANAHFLVVKSALARSTRQAFVEADKVAIQASLFGLQSAAAFET